MQAMANLIPSTYLVSSKLCFCIVSRMFFSSMFLHYIVNTKLVLRVKSTTVKGHFSLLIFHIEKKQNFGIPTTALLLWLKSWAPIAVAGAN
jgi:hypothetical protein